MRFLSDCMAALGATVLDLMTSEISRLSAISSLYFLSLARIRHHCSRRRPYRLLLVAFSICSSSAVLAEDDHQLIMMGRAASLGRRQGRKRCAVKTQRRRSRARQRRRCGNWMSCGAMEMQLRRARLWICVRSRSSAQQVLSAPLTTSAVASRQRRHQPPEQWLIRYSTAMRLQPRSCLYLVPVITVI